MDTGWTSSESISELSAALAEALPTLEDLKKDLKATVPTKAGGSYEYTYANLAQALDEIRPKLQAHGLVMMQAAHGGPRSVSVTTTLLHRSGQWITFAALALDAGSTPQSAGSAITYARRYSLLPALGLATEDDDGQAATKQIEQDELTVPVARADGYVARATAAGLSMFEIEDLVKEATGGRTVEARMVLEREFGELDRLTRRDVTRKRQDEAAEGPQTPLDGSESDAAPGSAG